jgi:hypothetical protein
MAEINPDTGSFVNITTPLGGPGVLDYFNSQTYAAATFAASTSYPLFTWPNDGSTWIISAISARYTTAAGSAATFQIEVAGAGTAPGSGLAQNSTGVALNGSANTTVNGVVTTQTPITAGTAVNAVVGSTATTSLVGLTITLTLQRIS